MKQSGEVMVHSYPSLPVLEDMLNTFAAERGILSAEDIVAKAQERPMEAELTAFWQYAKLVNPDVAPKYDYIPFCDHVHAALAVNFQASSRRRHLTAA